MLPSVRALARDLRISVITTRRAYDELEREGYIQTVAGKGSSSGRGAPTWCGRKTCGRSKTTFPRRSNSGGRPAGG